MLNDIVITEIKKPIIVKSPKGRQTETKNRSSFGLSFCASGQITYTHKENQYISTPNTVVLLPKGQTYSLVGDKDGLFPVLNFDCTNLDCENIVVFHLQNSEPYLKKYQKIQELFLFPNKQLQIYSIFYDILHHIMQEQTPQNSTLNQALKYIEDNLSDPNLSNTDIAKHCNISEVYFRKLFSKNYSISPKQYILEIRLQKAKQLLTDSVFSASSIGEMCGFSSLYTFSRCFKEKVGLSPTQYAKENRIYKI